MDQSPNRFKLIGYLEEALAPHEMAQVEERLRNSSHWRAALREIRSEVDSGEHSVATIWRRHRLTCPTRERLGAYLMGGLVPAEEDYVRFHLEVIQCRWCQANVSDLQSSVQADDLSEPETVKRRRRFFASSIRYLPGHRP